MVEASVLRKDWLASEDFMEPMDGSTSGRRFPLLHFPEFSGVLFAILFPFYLFCFVLFRNSGGYGLIRIGLCGLCLLIWNKRWPLQQKKEKKNNQKKTKFDEK